MICGISIAALLLHLEFGAAVVPERLPFRSAAPVPAAAAPPIAEKPRLGAGVFLVANRGLQDPNFFHTVILITHFDETGTAGLIVNRRLPLAAAEVLPALGKLDPDAGHLHLGGPVAINSLQFLVRVEAGIESAVKIFSDIYLIARRETLEDLLAGRITGTALRLFAGYAGWGPGQLETELLRGVWYLTEAEPDYVFSKSPESVWPELIDRVAARWAGAAVPGRSNGMRVETQYNAGQIVPTRAPLPASGRPGWRSRASKTLVLKSLFPDRRCLTANLPCEK